MPAFYERPKNIWAKVSAAASRNPNGEALDLRWRAAPLTRRQKPEVA